MRLLPDFTYDGVTLSMQYPYTINGYLIKELEVELLSERYIDIGRSSIDDTFFYKLCFIRYNSEENTHNQFYNVFCDRDFNSAFRAFLRDHSYFEAWRGIKRPYNLREYIKFVQMQCDRYKSVYSNELAKDICLLHNQRRNERYRDDYSWCYDLGDDDCAAERSYSNNIYTRQYLGDWADASNLVSSDALINDGLPEPLEANSVSDTIVQGTTNIIMTDGNGNEIVFNNVNISDISIENDTDELSNNTSNVDRDSDLIDGLPDIASPVGDSVSILGTTRTIEFRNGSSISFSSSSDSYSSSYTYSSSRNVSANADDHVLYIHRYNYKPEFIYHTLGQECSPLLLGAEIEVAGNTKDNERSTRNDIVKKCIQIMNGSDDTKEDLIYSTDDSTVQIEIDTMPCSLEFHKTMNYKKMFEYLDEQGYKGHDCDNAGLHIHADRKYLGDTVLKQQLVISKILYVLEKFNDQICMIARRGNYYSRFVGDGKNENTVVELYKKYKDRGKYVALNLGHKDTIEFRCFKSTLKYETFILTLEFVQDIIDFCKKINIEEIETIQWKDLMDTFSEELKKYYKERVEKEALKKKEKSAFDIKCDIASSESINGSYRYGGIIGTYTPHAIVNIRSPDECVDTSNNIGELPSGDIVFSHEDTERLMGETRVDTISSATSYLSDSFDELSSRVSDIEETIRQYQRQFECVENGVTNSESIADVAADLFQYYVHTEVCDEIDSHTNSYTWGRSLDSSPGLSNDETFIDSS